MTKPDYKQHVRPLYECVRKSDWRPRGQTEIEFLEKNLWPVFDGLPAPIREVRSEIEYAIAQLKAFFNDESVDKRAASIFALFLADNLDPHER